MIPRYFRRFLGILIGVVFMFAALGKAWDSSDIVTTIRYLLPGGLAGIPWIVNGIVLILVFVESVYAVLFLGDYVKRIHLVLCAVLVSLFTIILIKLKLDPYSPSCGCLGLLRFSAKMNHESGIGIVRNTAILGLLLIMMIDTERTRKSSSNKQGD